MQRNPPEHKVTCQWCEEEFLAQRSDARFCTSSCRSYAHRYGSKSRSKEKPTLLDAWTSSEPVGATYGARGKSATLGNGDARPLAVETVLLPTFVPYEKPWMYGPPGEIVQVRYRVFSFASPAALHRYLNHYLRDREGSKEIKVKGSRLYVPASVVGVV